VRVLCIMAGAFVVVATFGWFFYLVPLGCAMNTTTCSERFTVWSEVGLLHFWLPFCCGAVLLFAAARR